MKTIKLIAIDQPIIGPKSRMFSEVTTTQLSVGTITGIHSTHLRRRFKSRHARSKALEDWLGIL
jgi:hypothetical protein